MFSKYEASFVEKVNDVSKYDRKNDGWYSGGKF